MNWVIAIPSYQRSDIIRTHTLAVLARYDIPHQLITVFVSDSDQYLEYRSVIPITIQIIVGKLGLAEQRGCILDHFPIGTHIVMIDDDLSGFVERREDGGIRPLTSLRAVIDKGFAEAVKANCCLWGVYPVPNGFFMRPTITQDLKFIIGSFWGIINPGSSGDRGISSSLSEKEDYFRTLICFERDGAVVRINDVSPKTKYYATTGGMQSNPNRVRDQKLAVDFLMNKWPTLVYLNTRRKNSEFPEVLLRSARAPRAPKE